MGFLEFDGVRYWDYRYMVRPYCANRPQKPYKIYVEPPMLPSDPQFRPDYQ